MKFQPTVFFFFRFISDFGSEGVRRDRGSNWVKVQTVDKADRDHFSAALIDSEQGIADAVAMVTMKFSDRWSVKFYLALQVQE